MGGYGEELEYDAPACVYLCVEGLRVGECTERDIEFCFELADEVEIGLV